MTWTVASRRTQRGGHLSGFAPPGILGDVSGAPDPIKDDPDYYATAPVKQVWVSVVDWERFKIPRPTPDANGGEGQTLDHCENSAFALRWLWTALNGVRFAAATQQDAARWVESLLTIDSKGVHDSVHNIETMVVGMQNTSTVI